MKRNETTDFTNYSDSKQTAGRDEITKNIKTPVQPSLRNTMEDESFLIAGQAKKLKTKRLMGNF